ncbi:dienelactone hydrolase family protein [Paenibacillus polymyxa]|uniref:dienelactone hydrolase family protein n=1 Tax=Paenibacillus polymyxa TaxID=1406 RepID=UPI0025B70AFB|nr:dienelactone hydrolase family protein [Paenibacillus polymyxa]MDN4080390.1 dienelactone hydrolase family protein [Paenibacillus polymyxa]MDN4105668.1 dienelactone hydrolase family protein [Paenibacillus polymyxa]MDN4115886.1 dienelactone hydrolase family protein [Paenibacillus polymyxa]
MISIDKKSDTLIVLLHEIYGINQHIQNFCSLLSDENYDVICPNLIGKETPFDYSQEEAAYAHFMKNIGFERASYHIESLLLSIQARYKKVFIVGFSIGATIAWLCSKEKYVDGIVGYYGSRIRNYLEITPHCPTLLFFPQEEISFNVDELISALDNHNIRVHKFSGQHGFSDPYSPRYHVHSAQQSFIEMVEFFRKADQ